MNSALNRIRQGFSGLSKTEGIIATFILKNPSQCAIYSIKELSSATGTSKASIMRFAKKLGYNGYQVLDSIREKYGI